MLIQLNRPDIIENVRSRFDARETGQRRPLELDDTTKLFLNIDELTRWHSIEQVTLTPTGTGYITLFDVPDGERWFVQWVQANRVSGDATFDVLAINDNVSSGNCDFHSATAASKLTLPRNLADFWMDSGWSMRVDVAAWTSGNITGKIMYVAYESY